jgi:ABC-type branched-subunit amino acid transport system substrate-binding protein
VTADDDNAFKPPVKKRRWLKVVVVGMVVAVVGGWFVDTLIHACGGLNSGVTEIDSECIGVTDGSYVFDPLLADVEAKIAAENAKVTGSGHTVTIALLNPMTVNNTSPVSIAEVRNQLEGAYTAQHRVNQPGVLDDAYPLIRLVLANEGSHEDQWQPVVHQLEAMVGDDKDPLVAVTGLGLSVTQTSDGAKDLAKHRIPMVGAITTADELRYTNIRGFVRVAPTDQESVQSLLAYLQAHPQLDSAILVYDSNSDDPTSPDLFTRSLRDDLRGGMSSLIKSTPSLSFVGASGQSEASPDLFSNITTNVCAVKPKVVLYAGRWLDLLSFLTSLEHRVCSDAPMTVVTANTNLGPLTNEEKDLRDKKITVVNATANDPLGWPNKAPGTPTHFPDFQSEFSALGFDPAHLDDGDAIATHDALFVAVKATRLAVPPAPSARNGVPKAVDVLNQLLNLNNLNTVPGASGELSFSLRGTRGEDSGNPCGKPIPVLEMPSSGPSSGKPYVTCGP